MLLGRQVVECLFQGPPVMVGHDVAKPLPQRTGARVAAQPQEGVIGGHDHGVPVERSRCDGQVVKWYGDERRIEGKFQLAPPGSLVLLAGWHWAAVHPPRRLTLAR